ncbi:MAG: HD domain-containing protein [Oscillospiraceae bacterium]|nr:HD domain-containing protein [Oscillospiraceae bacterium]
MKYIDMVYNDSAMCEMLKFVEAKLKPVDDCTKSGKRFEFRSRFGHTKRVLEWALRINEIEKADAGILTVAAIFHDVGYCVRGEEHAGLSEEIFREYITNAATEADCVLHGDKRMPLVGDLALTERIEEIAAVIAGHSDKDHESSLLTKEQMILMDADLMDENGAMRVLWDCFNTTEMVSFNYETAYKEIEKSYESLAGGAHLIHTGEGKRFYHEMCDYVEAFVRGLRLELGL